MCCGCERRLTASGYNSTLETPDHGSSPIHDKVPEHQQIAVRDSVRRFKFQNCHPYEYSSPQPTICSTFACTPGRGDDLGLPPGRPESLQHAPRCSASQADVRQHLCVGRQVECASASCVRWIETPYSESVYPARNAPRSVRSTVSVWDNAQRRRIRMKSAIADCTWEHCELEIAPSSSRCTGHPIPRRHVIRIQEPAAFASSHNPSISLKPVTDRCELRFSKRCGPVVQAGHRSHFERSVDHPWCTALLHCPARRTDCSIVIHNATAGMALLQATAVRTPPLAQQATAAPRRLAAALPARDASAAASRSQQPSLSRIISPCLGSCRALCLDARRTRSLPLCCAAGSQLAGISPDRPLGALPPQSFPLDGGQEGTQVSWHDLPQVAPSHLRLFLRQQLRRCLTPSQQYTSVCPPVAISIAKAPPLQLCLVLADCGCALF